MMTFGTKKTAFSELIISVVHVQEEDRLLSEVTPQFKLNNQGIEY